MKSESEEGRDRHNAIILFEMFGISLSDKKDFITHITSSFLKVFFANVLRIM